MRYGMLVAVLKVGFPATEAKALDLSDDLSITGYVDARLIAPTDQKSWLKGGQGKFRYGSGQNFGGEAILQADWRVTDGLNVIAVGRLEPQTPSIADALETYVRYAPQSEGPFSWSVKAGAFFPTISLENDDLGWASPYTLTPSAINSWIGDEIRTIGSEGTLRWNGGSLGTISLIGALTCCNDEAGVLIADRGWAMDDRPFGLFERERVPDQTLRIFMRPCRAAPACSTRLTASWAGTLAPPGNCPASSSFPLPATTIRASPRRWPVATRPGAPSSG